MVLFFLSIFVHVHGLAEVTVVQILALCFICVFWLGWAV
jgi:hypothetical protein